MPTPILTLNLTGKIQSATSGGRTEFLASTPTTETAPGTTNLLALTNLTLTQIAELAKHFGDDLRVTVTFEVDR